MKKAVLHDPKLQFAQPLIPLTEVTHLVIHHTEKFGWDIHRTHHHHLNKNGWDGVGYNYFIEYDSSIQIGRGLHVGAHAYGHNRNSIGICVTGNYDYETLSPDMRETLYVLCLHFMEMFHLNPSDVYGHRELGAKKTCPGTSIDMEVIRYDLKELLKKSK